MNVLKPHLQATVFTLLERGQSQREIERLTGIDRKEVGALIFPTAAVRQLAGLAASASLQEVLESAPVQAHFQQVLDGLARQATGSASRIARLHLMHQPPSIDLGEVTDKGSLNVRAIQARRAEALARLYDDKDREVMTP